MKMRITLLIFIISIGFLVMLPSCQNEYNGLPEDLKTCAMDNDFPYNSLLKKAKSGDKESIEKMLLFWDKTDAGASFSHSVYIYVILESTGEAVFVDVLKNQSNDLQNRTIMWMKDRDKQLHKNYPLVFNLDTRQSKQ